MAPKPKVSPDQVIHVYYERKRVREANGKTARGLNTEVGDLLGLSPQRVGQVIREYEAHLMEAKVLSNDEPKVSEKETKASSGKKWKDQSGKARKKLEQELGGDAEHQGPELETGGKEASEGGGSWLSRLNGDGVIKKMVQENRKLEQRLAELEAQIAAIRVSRDPLDDPSPAPRREQILEVLADGRSRTYSEIQEQMDYFGNIRPAMLPLVRSGKVIKVKTESNRKNEPHYRFRISKELLDQM